MRNKLARLSIPYVVWMALFVVAPIVMVVFYAFTAADGGFTFGNFGSMGTYAVVFGRKALYPIYLYVMLEFLFYGLNLWSINYLYIWVVLALGAYLLRKMEHPLGWAILSGTFGLLFGALCGIVDVFIGGFGYAVAKWVSGIPFDISHCIGNFVIALLLFKPMRQLMQKLYTRMGR